MAACANGHDDFVSEESDRSARLTIGKISCILEKVIDRLGTESPASGSKSEEQTNSHHASLLFALKCLPKIKMRDYVDRFYQYGHLTPNLILAGLILFDRALKTRLFSTGLAVHK